MITAGLVLSVVLGAPPASSSTIEMVGRIKLPAAEVTEVQKAAAAAGIPIVAIEKVREEYLEMILGYGPATKGQSGACRGPVYVAGPETEDDRTTPWKIVPLQGTNLDMSYALDGGRCPGPLSARVRILGKFADADVLGILEAIRKRRPAHDVSGQPVAVNIATGFTLDTIVREDQDNQAHAWMVGGAEGEALKVQLFRIEGTWLIIDVEQEPGSGE